jgi:hypothetical protein
VTVSTDPIVKNSLHKLPSLGTLPAKHFTPSAATHLPDRKMAAIALPANILVDGITVGRSIREIPVFDVTQKKFLGRIVISPMPRKNHGN